MDHDQPARILVALDPDKRPEDPLTLGVRLAQLASAPFEVVAVFDRPPLRGEDDLMRQIREAAEADLQTVVDRLEGVGAARARVVGAASPARALQELSEDDGVGVVVIGSTTRGPLRRTLPGSIADRLLSGAASSVAIAPHGFAEDPPPRLATVGVAYDGSMESRSALDGGRRLALAAGAHLRVITVHQPVAFGGLPTSALALETANQAYEREQRTMLDDAVAERAVPSIEGVFRIGRTVDVLVEESGRVDLLLAGSRGYGPLGAVLLGSTTHDLARLAQAPVLITPRGKELAIP